MNFFFNEFVDSYKKWLTMSEKAGSFTDARLSLRWLFINYITALAINIVKSAIFLSTIAAT